MDLFRIIYGFLDVGNPNAEFTVSEITRAKLLNSTIVGKPTYVNGSITNYSNYSRHELAGIFAESEVCHLPHQRVFGMDCVRWFGLI